MKLVSHVFGSIKDTKILDRGLYFINKFEDSTEKIQIFKFFSNVLNKLPRLFLEVLGIIIILSVTILFIANDRSIDTIIPTLGLLGAAIIRMLPSFNGITNPNSTKYKYLFTAAKGLIKLIYGHYSELIND